MKIKKMQNNKSGFVLVLTLLCAVIVSAAMMSTMFVSTKGQKIVKNFKESVQTLDAADAAIKKAKQALATYMTNYQMDDLAGAEGNFTQVLFNSLDVQALAIPPAVVSEWQNINVFGNNVTVTVSDNDDGDGDTSTDSDRIILLTAEATSPTNQRVRIQATVQAPSSSNTNSGMPTITQAMFMCSDTLARRQQFKVKRETLVSGYDHLTLPDVFPSGTSFYDASPDYAPTGTGVPAAILVNGATQSVDIDGAAIVIGENAGEALEGEGAVLTLSDGDDGADCTNIFAFVDQLSLLSDSLPNVNVITASTVGTGSLGTRASPVISIINGVTTVSRGRSTKSKVTFNTGTSGAGIMLLQGETETNNTSAVFGKNFYYEGLIVVYGDDKAKLKFKKEEMIYGAAIALTGSDDANDKIKITLDKDGIFAYSSTALSNANSAYGNAVGTPLITETTDPRNTVITVGWYEDYDF